MPEEVRNINYLHPGNASAEEMRELVTRRFTYKPWGENQVERGKQVTSAAIEMGVSIVMNVPPSGTRTRALNLVEEARMLANAAITHEGEF